MQDLNYWQNRAMNLEDKLTRSEAHSRTLQGSLDQAYRELTAVRSVNDSLEDLLRSAHAIALRKGADTAWERFAESIQRLGIGPVTARTYRIIPSDSPDETS